LKPHGESVKAHRLKPLLRPEPVISPSDCCLRAGVLRVWRLEPSVPVDGPALGRQPSPVVSWQLALRDGAWPGLRPSDSPDKATCRQYVRGWLTTWM